MKITIELSTNEVLAIKEYLLDTEIRPNKNNIQVYIDNIVKSTLYNEHEAICDYINNKNK